MEIVTVVTKKQKQDFINLPVKIYSGDNNWIRPLDKDIEDVFDATTNKFFRHGSCVRFLLLSNNNCIGRVAAFINEKTAKREQYPTGGIGFFECIDDVNAAKILFDAAKKWLTERGMHAMDGPINFGEREAWWGLIVDGFSPPPYKMNYNKPYYKHLFEHYGFKEYFKQLCFGLDPKKEVDAKLIARHAIIAANKDYRFECLQMNLMSKYAEDFKTVYNSAWVKHGEGKALESHQVQAFFKKMKPVIDPKLVYYVYFKNEPVAFFINLPDINQLFKKFNGRFGIVEKLKFITMLKMRSTKKIIGLVFGVVPQHQGLGVDSFMIVEASKIIRLQLPYTEYEMQWIGDFNPKMVSVAQSLTTHQSRMLITYRKLFDEKRVFERHPIFS
ncbi:MAG: hypothetical protein JNK61_01790 [Bacteroidia bacterium]|nr:hypothetical protein [Bacteroidia bacterium]